MTDMSKKNDFTEDLTTYLDMSVDLIHLISFMPWQLKMAKSTVKKSAEILEKQGGPKNGFGPATGSSLINIFHDGELVTRAPAGKRITVGHDVDRMAAEVEGRFCGSVLSSLHEAWENYAKSLYAKMLWHLRDDFTLPKRAGFHEKNMKWRTYHKTPEYFQDYMKYACHSDCAEALNAFRTKLDWSIVHVKWWLADDDCVIEWMEVVRMLAFCRNCIVHNNGHVYERSLKKYNRQQQHVIQAMMSKTILSDELRILPPASNARRILEAMMTLGWGIYVLLSKRCSLTVEYDPFKKKLPAKT